MTGAVQEQGVTSPKGEHKGSFLSVLCRVLVPAVSHGSGPGVLPSLTRGVPSGQVNICEILKSWWLCPEQGMTHSSCAARAMKHRLCHPIHMCLSKLSAVEQAEGVFLKLRLGTVPLMWLNQSEPQWAGCRQSNAEPVG